MCFVLSYLFTQLTSLASVSPLVNEEVDPMRWRGYLCYDIWWSLGMKKRPWDSSWDSADVAPAGKSDKACSSHPAPFCTLSTQGGTRTNTFVYTFPDSSFFRFFELPFAVRVTLLCGGTDIQMLEGCWAGGLGIRVSHCRGRGRWCVSGSHWDHLLMDVCQLAQPFLWYYYFRDKKRPAG